MKWPLFLQLAHDDEEHSSPKKYAMPEDLIPVLKVGIGRLRKFLGNHNFDFCAIYLYFINRFLLRELLTTKLTNEYRLNKIKSK